MQAAGPSHAGSRRRLAYGFHQPALANDGVHAVDPRHQLNSNYAAIDTGSHRQIPDSRPDSAQLFEQLRVSLFQKGGVGDDQINGNVMTFRYFHRFTTVLGQQRAYSTHFKDSGYKNKNCGFRFNQQY